MVKNSFNKTPLFPGDGGIGGVGPLESHENWPRFGLLEALETLGRSCEKLQRWRVTKRIGYGWH